MAHGWMLCYGCRRICPPGDSCCAWSGKGRARPAREVEILMQREVSPFEEFAIKRELRYLLAHTRGGEP